MVYVLINNKIEKINIENILKELDIKELIIDEDNLINNSSKEINKAKIIICDYDIDNVKYYLSKKKKVIVYKGTNKKNNKDDDILYEKNVYTYNKKNELREILCFIKNREKLKKTIIKLFLFIIILLLISILFFVQINNKTKSNKNVVKDDVNEVSKESTEEKEIDYTKENIVFLGDSITDFYDLEKFYPNIPAVNSGISGNQTTDVLERIENDVYKYNPTKVFLLIGTNDTELSDRTNEEIVANIKEIIDDIKENRPLAKIYVESVYPVNRNTDNDIVNISMVRERNNERIKKINVLIKDLAKEENIEYIDMYNLLIDDNDDLKLEYTVDGLHMSDAGYEVITNKLMEYINNSNNK